MTRPTGLLAIGPTRRARARSGGVRQLQQQRQVEQLDPEREHAADEHRRGRRRGREGRWYCSIDSHKQMGMKGEITVQG